MKAPPSPSVLYQDSYTSYSKPPPPNLNSHTVLNYSPPPPSVPCPSSPPPPTFNADPPSSSPPPTPLPGSQQFKALTVPSPSASLLGHSPPSEIISPPPMPYYNPTPYSSPPLSPPLPSPSPPFTPLPTPTLYPSPPYAAPPAISSPPPPFPISSSPPLTYSSPSSFYYQSPPSPPLSDISPVSPSPSPFSSRQIIYYSPPPPPSPPSQSPPPPKNFSPPLASHPPPTLPGNSSSRVPPYTIPLPSPLTHRSPPALPSATPVNPTQNANVTFQNINSQKSIATTGAVATVAVLAGLVMLTFAGAAVWFIKKRKKPTQSAEYGGNFIMASPIMSSYVSETSYARSPYNPIVRHGSGSYGYPYSPAEQGLGNTRLLFTLEKLSVITNGFSTQNLLGEGGFGCVYKGCLPDGREVAIKQFKVGGAQGEREFRAEVETISRVHHRHLVSLVGYCISENKRLVVYDYVPNKTLHYHLHGREMPILQWFTRLKIAVGAARGIAYLHEDCHPRIIHRDIKSSNILLNNNFEAQVSDFGLARSAVDSNTHVTTRVMGTFGYLAPEYASSGKLTAKSDVYSFGVVLLELITGRKPVDTSQPLGDESLVEWARPLLIQALETEDLGDLPDPRLEDNYDKNEMSCMIQVAAACVRHSSSMRPQMGQVVRALSGLADSDINNGVRPGQSEVFSSPQQSEEIRRFQRTRFASQDYSEQRMRFGSQDYSSEYRKKFSSQDYSSDCSRSSSVSRTDL